MAERAARYGYRSSRTRTAREDGSGRPLSWLQRSRLSSGSRSPMGRSGCRSARACCSVRSASCSASGSRVSSGCSADAPAGETLGVGLASGLLVLASWWAAIASGGRSSFTPVAVGFAVAIGLAVVRRDAHRRLDPEMPPRHRMPSATDAAASIWLAADLVVAILGGAVFVVAVALLYGSTLVPSPRDGVQPLEFMDEAYYSVLGRGPRQDRDRDDLLAVRLRSASTGCRPRPGTTGASCGSPRPRSRSSARRRSMPATSSCCPSCCWRRPR